MKYEIVITEAALQDAEIIFDWYEEQLPGLGEKFILALEVANKDLLRSPFAFAKWKKDIRKMVMRKFPYKIFYKIKGNTIVINTIAHVKRSNKFLKRRM